MEIMRFCMKKKRMAPGQASVEYSLLLMIAVGLALLALKMVQPQFRILRDRMVQSIEGNFFPGGDRMHRLPVRPK